MLEYEVIPVTSYEQNCSLIWCTETHRGVLVDPGGESARLLNHVKRQGVTLEAVLLTHGHLDHVGGAHEIAAQTGVPILGPHGDDDYWLKGLPEQSRRFGFPFCPALTPTRWLTDQESLSVGHLTLQVLHIPGHTPGHVVFFSESAQRVWVGDVLFNGSIGRTDFPGGNYNALIQGIETKLLPLGDGVKFVPGHGPESTLGHERKTNPYLR